jgi:hypothetical protein
MIPESIRLMQTTGERKETGLERVSKNPAKLRLSRVPCIV